MFLYKSSGQDQKLVDVNTTSLSKYEQRQNHQQTVSQPKKLLESTIILLSGAKAFRFSCQRGHKHAVFAHTSPALC